MFTIIEEFEDQYDELVDAVSNFGLGAIYTAMQQDPLFTEYDCHMGAMSIEYDGRTWIHEGAGDFWCSKYKDSDPWGADVYLPEYLTTMFNDLHNLAEAINYSDMDALFTETFPFALKLPS